MKASIEEQVAQAMANYKAKYPEAAQDKIKEVTEKITRGITQASQRDLAQQREVRHERRLAVNKLIQDAGVKLFYVRDKIVHKYVMHANVVTTEISTIPTGGLTIAVKAEENNPVAQVAFTFCHSKENFDYVQAREIVMDRFLKGQVYPLPAKLVSAAKLRNFNDARLVKKIARSLVE